MPPKLNNQSSGTNPTASMCVHCKKKPRYVDGATVHPYCGMTCVSLAKILKGSNTQNNWSSMYRSGQTCAIPGCSSPVFFDSCGDSKYCTRTHRWLGKNGCISCRKAPANGSALHCQSCFNNISRTAPMIVKVPSENDKYEGVESQFRKKWLHSDKKTPEVRAIYKIVNTATNVTKYQQYLDKVETKGKFFSKDVSRGNERRRWHGTKRTCNIGDEGKTQLCTAPSCSLCGIIKNSFDLSFSAKNTGFKRFGTGIYTSSTSSKADDYSHNGCVSDWEAMLLNTVVVGKGYKTEVDELTRTAPPAGYDSVIGEVGSVLNYDELVVYNNDAILPSYLVMYEIPRRPFWYDSD